MLEAYLVEDIMRNGLVQTRQGMNVKFNVEDATEKACWVSAVPFAIRVRYKYC